MKKNLMQLGRSMVEMLGVLAIIGVLSIVGIAGYKRAMTRSYINDTMESVQKFRVVVEEYLLFHPEKKGNESIKMSELDRKDCLPSFAKDSFTDFNVLLRLYPTDNKPYVTVFNIKKSGLCSALLPNGTKGKWDTTHTGYTELIQQIDDLTWHCRIKVDADNVPVCDL